MDIDSYGISKEMISSFANCVRMSNAAKFAKYIPQQNESEQCMLQTKDMITEIEKTFKKKTDSAV